MTSPKTCHFLYFFTWFRFYFYERGCAENTSRQSLADCFGLFWLRMYRRAKEKEKGGEMLASEPRGRGHPVRGWTTNIQTNKQTNKLPN
jgi:hypothetical protein